MTLLNNVNEDCHWNSCPGSSRLLCLLVCLAWWFFLLLYFPSFLLSLVRAVGLSFACLKPITCEVFRPHAAGSNVLSISCCTLLLIFFRPAQPLSLPKGHSSATWELLYCHLVPQSDSLFFTASIPYLDMQHQPRISFVHVCRLKRSIHSGWSWVYKVPVWRLSPSWTCVCFTSPTSDQGSFLCLMMPSQTVGESHMPLHIIRWGKQHPTLCIPSH